MTPPTPRLADDVRDEVHLFFEFNRAIDTLTKRYGVINVADQCRGYADFIQRLQAGIEMRHSDGPGCGSAGAVNPTDPRPDEVQ